MNLAAFRMGRLAIHDRAALDRQIGPATTAPPATGDDRGRSSRMRARNLVAYQDQALADRYRARVGIMTLLEREKAPGKAGLAEAVAKAYFKLLAYKDEYEVARLHTEAAADADIAHHFEGVRHMDFHLAPPLLSPCGRTR